MKTNKSRLSLFIMMTFMLFAIVPDTFAQLKHGDVTLKVGEYSSVSLADAYQRTLRDATGVSYRWSSTGGVSITSSSSTYCSIYGNSAGTGRINYYCSYYINGFYRTMDFYWDVTIQSNGPTSITVSPGSLTMYEGDDDALYASLSGGTSSISWSSSNSSVVSVSGSGNNAYVTARSAGTAYVYARTGNGLSDYCYITVKEKTITPTSITLPATASVTEGEYTTISATVYPSNASYSLTWSSADTDIATVSSGRVYGKKAGTVRITAKIDGYSLSDYCNVTVKAKNVTATGLELNMPTTFEIGETYKVTPTITPENSTVSYTYKSSNESVATVSSAGVVTACGKGLAVITVTEKNSGLTATANVNVIENSWSGTYSLKASVETSQNATREYPNQFTMTISRSNCQYYVTSFLFNDEIFESVNDGGIPVNVISEENGELDISMCDFLTYDRSTYRLYVVCAYDEEADDWTDRIPLVRNVANGSLQVGDFYVASFEYDETTEGWASSGYIEAVYYDISTNNAEPSGTNLYPLEMSILAGESSNMSIHLDNETPIIMFEFYMQLPDGLYINMDDDGYYDATLNGDRSDRTHALDVEKGDDGLYHFLCYSNKNKPFLGNEGELLSVSIGCNEDVKAGIYHGVLKGILLSDEDKNAIELQNVMFNIEVTDNIPGDLTGDKKINGMDIVEMVELIMDKKYMRAADLYPVGNPDGVVNGMDLVQEVELVMAQSASQNAPGVVASRKSEDMTHQDGLKVSDVTVEQGGTFDMSVELENPNYQYIMTEFWMSLPDGVSISRDESGEYIYEESERFDRTHRLSISKEEEGNIYHFLIYSDKNKPLKGNSGVLFKLSLEAASDAVVNTYQEKIFNQIFSDTDKQEHNPADVVFNVTVERNPDVGIDTLKLDKSAEAEWYSIQGIRINQPTRKGVYIRNGRTIVVK